MDDGEAAALAEHEAIATALIDAVCADPGGRIDDVLAAARRRLGGEHDGDEHGEDDHLEDLLEHALDDLEGDDELAMLAGDRVVHVASALDGRVLTHRLTDRERDTGTLDVSFDLAPLAWLPDLRLASGETIEAVGDLTGDIWEGPPGWLADAAVVAVSVDAAGLVHLSVLDEEPPADPALVAAIRAAYDIEVAEPGLPVEGRDLVLGALLDHPGAFTEPSASLDRLCREAGLERRGGEVAHDEEVWSQGTHASRMGRAFGYFADDPVAIEAALDVLEVAAAPDPQLPDLRRAITALGDEDVFVFVTEELVGPELDAGTREQAERFAERAVAAAQRGPDVATARLLAAVIAERTGRVEVAAGHVDAAVRADPDNETAIDRAAWYASDRGDARNAARWWRLLADSLRATQDLDTVEPFARPQQAAPGRNEPCWCGSGRKFKHCHRQLNALPPLPERVGWLCRKAVGYLERRGRTATGPILAAATARAVDPDDPRSLARAFEDPLVFDVVLTEGGWFERFLAERGPLLPDDEAMLGSAWVLVPRTLYEVEDVRPGAGLTLRDLGAGEPVEVTERTLSATVSPGQVICARAVPDGAGHQLIGGVFAVAPGTEAEVLAACDQGRGEALCAYVANLERPPRMSTREGERLVACTAVLRVPDPPGARRLLDTTYRAAGDGWEEWHELDGDESILRAQLSLAGDQLTVETHSEERLERVLGVLGEGLGELECLRDERVPLRAGALPEPPGGRLPLPPEGAADLADPAVIAELQDRHERRWIAEPVPALRGLTPRQAADDPTRREDVRRLLATFPDPETLPAGMFALRPGRLRALLGLDDR